MAVTPRRPVAMIVDDEEDDETSTVSVDDQLYANMPVVSKNAIPIDALVQYVKDRKAGDNKLYSVEFKVSPRSRVDIFQGEFEVEGRYFSKFV